MSDVSPGSSSVPGSATASPPPSHSSQQQQQQQQQQHQQSQDKSTSSSSSQAKPPTIGSIFRSFTTRNRSSTLSGSNPSANTANTSTLSDRLTDILATERERREAPRAPSTSSSTGVRTGHGLSQQHHSAVLDDSMYDIGPYDATPYAVFLQNVLDAQTPKTKAETLTRLCSALRNYEPSDPIQAWQDVSRFANTNEPPQVRLATLEVLHTCIDCFLAHDTLFSVSADRAFFYQTLVQFEDPDPSHIVQLTTSLSLLTRGGRDISGYPEIALVLSTWAKRLFVHLQSQRDVTTDSGNNISVNTKDKDINNPNPNSNSNSSSNPNPPASSSSASVLSSSSPSPSFPNLGPLLSFNTPFVRRPTYPNIPFELQQQQSPNTTTTPLALLIALHKFSFSQIPLELIDLAANTILDISCSSTAEDDVEAGLVYVDVVFRFGYIPTQHLQDFVNFVARTAALANRAHVLDFLQIAEPSLLPPELDPQQQQQQQQAKPVLMDLPLKLPEMAHSCMKNLLKSPANQVLRHLRKTLTGPPKSLSSNPEQELECDDTLLVGSLACLRRVMTDYTITTLPPSSSSTTSGHPGPNSSSPANDPLLSSSPIQPPKMSAPQYPVSLSFGLALVYPQLCAIVEWKSPVVDAEILGLLDDMLELENTRYVRNLANQAASTSSNPSTSPTVEMTSPTSDSGNDSTTTRRHPFGHNRSRSKEDNSATPTKPKYSFDLWDMTLDLLQKTFWHVSAWQQKNGSAWIFNFASKYENLQRRDSTDSHQTSATTDHFDRSQNLDSPRRTSSRPYKATPHQPVLDIYTTILDKVLSAEINGEYQGPPLKLEKLMSNALAHLSDGTCYDILCRIESNNLIMPSNPMWIDRLNTILDIYLSDLLLQYQRSQDAPAENSDGFRSRSYSFLTTRPRAKRKALSIIKNTYDFIRAVDDFRITMIGRVVIPLLDESFIKEFDPFLRQDLNSIMRMVVQDCLTDPFATDKDPAELRKDEIISNNSFDTLFEIITSATSKALVYSTTERNIPPPEHHVSSSRPPYRELLHLNQYQRDLIAFEAVKAHIMIFHTGLEVSTFRASQKSIRVFNSLLNFLSPPPDTSAQSLPHTPEEAQAKQAILILPKRARLLALSWFVRFRADENYRIRIIRDVDLIEELSSILKRIAQTKIHHEPTHSAGSGTTVMSNTTTGRRDASPSGLANNTNRASLGRRSALGATALQDSSFEERGRSSEPYTFPPRPGSSRTTTETSPTRNQTQDSSSSTAGAATTATPTGAATNSSPTTGMGSSLPKTATASSYVDHTPFSEPDVVEAYGTGGLTSFDHDLMRDYTEVSEPDETMPITTMSASDNNNENVKPRAILPISKWFKAVYNIVKEDSDSDIIAYLLCYLPAQLSNKALSCGPSVAPQIRLLQKLLCEGLITNVWPKHFPKDAPRKIRGELHCAAYHTLLSLVAYRNLFAKTNQDDMVKTFVLGLTSVTAATKPCIHALYLCAFDLKLSVTKYLPGVLETLSRIVSRPGMAVHILDFIGAIGKLPSLFANFTDNDYRSIFGIALQYITMHTERTLQHEQQQETTTTNNTTTAPESEIQYAFSQYVYHLAYSIINIWFMALKVSDRKKHVPFLTRKLVKANEGRKELDEPTEVCFDMLARCVYSNASARPGPPSNIANELLAPLPSLAQRSAGASAGSISSFQARHSSINRKSWIIGNSLLTIRKLAKRGWVDVTVRRPSGQVHALVELTNSTHSKTLPDDDTGIASLLLRRKEELKAKNLEELTAAAQALVDNNNNSTNTKDNGANESTNNSSQIIPSFPKINRSKSANEVGASTTSTRAHNDKSVTHGLLDHREHQHSYSPTPNTETTRQTTSDNSNNNNNNNSSSNNSTTLSSNERLASQKQMNSNIVDLVVEPSFYALQVAPFVASVGASSSRLDGVESSTYPTPVTLIPDEDKYLRTLNVLDTVPVVDFHKIGIIYAGRNQTTEAEMLGNTHGSSTYLNFLSKLGRLVRLKGCRDMYLGGLDTEHDTDGLWTLVWSTEESQIVFHVASLMPTDLERDPQCTRKKAHIGNDFVRIIFNESGLPYNHETIASHFNFVNIVIEPHYMVKSSGNQPLSGTSTGLAGLSKGALQLQSSYYKVTMQCRSDMPDFGPLGTYKTISAESLGPFVRQVSLHANIFANVFLECVGVDGARGKQKVEFVSNWRHRLQLIKRLKTQVETALNTASGNTASPSVDQSATQQATATTTTVSTSTAQESSTIVSSVGQSITQAMNIGSRSQMSKNPSEIDAGIRRPSAQDEETLDIEETIRRHDFSSWTD